MNSYKLEINLNKINKLCTEFGFDISVRKIAQLALRRVGKKHRIKTLHKRNRILGNLDLGYLSKDIESLFSIGFLRPLHDIRRDYKLLPKSLSKLIISRADTLLNNKFTIYDNLKITYPENRFSWFYDPLTKFDWPKDSRSFNIPGEKPKGTDIKTIWEIARFQFLSVLSQAYLLTGKKRYAQFAIEKVQLWIKENQFLMGPHWLMPMESSIRLINWCVYLPMLDFDKNSNRLFINNLTQSILEHLIFIRENLEYSIFRENNHYFSNIVGLIPARLLFPSLKWAVDCTQFALKEFTQEIQAQFDSCGMNFEGSLPYHRLSSEMCLVGFALLKRTGLKVASEVTERLEQIKNFTEYYTSISAQIPVIGDNDSGLFLDLFPGQASNRHGYLSNLFNALLKNQCKPDNYNDFLNSVNFVKTSLPGSFSSQRKSGSHSSVLKLKNFDGLIIGQNGNEGIFFNTLQSSQGHTHNDKLAVYPVIDKNLLFIDRGTFSYSGYPHKRHEDRLSNSHNGPVINGWEQNRIWEKDLFYISKDTTCESAIDISGKTIIINGWHTGYNRYRRGMKVFRKVIWDTIERTMTINDWIECINSKERYTFSWNFLINPRWAVREKNNIFTFTKEGQQVYFKDVDNIGLSLVQGRFCPQYQQELPCLALKGAFIAMAGRRIHFVLQY